MTELTTAFADRWTGREASDVIAAATAAIPIGVPDHNAIRVLKLW